MSQLEKKLAQLHQKDRPKPLPPSEESLPDEPLVPPIDETTSPLHPEEPPSAKVLQLPKERRDRAERLLNKRKAELHADYEERRHGPQGEKRTTTTSKVRMIKMEDLVSDGDFKNLKVDPTQEEIDTLKESMNREGLKVPIIVVEGLDGKFFVRAGFRRSRCARLLGWSQIPAVVLPADTPEKTEHWVNIVENFTRCRVHPYETAVAAQTMRDKFKIDAREFASRAGFDVTYIKNLLHALDNLPPEIVQRWRERRLVPTEYFIKWSYMSHEEAIKSFNVYAGLHPRVSSASPPTTRPKQRVHPIAMASKTGLRRMERVWFAIASSTKISDEEHRKELIELVEFCLGKRTQFRDIYDDNAKHRSTKGRDGRRSKPKEVASFQLVTPEDDVELKPEEENKIRQQLSLLSENKLLKGNTIPKNH
jgi:ParB/RepB/Spo0J family partition protein